LTGEVLFSGRKFTKINKKDFAGIEDFWKKSFNVIEV